MEDRPLFVVFDVDGTLIDENDVPRVEVLDILREHHKRGDVIYVWSGGGVGYAKSRVLELGISALVTGFVRKAAGQGFDVAYDDQDVKLATVNRRV